MQIGCGLLANEYRGFWFHRSFWISKNKQWRRDKLKGFTTARFDPFHIQIPSLGIMFTNYVKGKLLKWHSTAITKAASIE